VTISAPDVASLQGMLAGEVVLPGSPGYESARKPAIARFHDTRPQAVVLCESPADVTETISFTRRAGLHAAIRGGGHCFAGRSSTNGIVIDTTPMRSVSVSDGVATVGAGARLGELYDSLNEHGVTIPAGCGPSVGIAGLTLGGGLGVLGRTHGLTCDHLLAAQVVLADGRVVECDEHHDAELVWALRGAGGGNFGVVTSLVLGTVPEPEATSFHLVWPHTHAAAVVEAWQAWAPAAPDALAASLLVTVSGDPARPPVVNVFGAMLGSESDTDELLEELVARAGTDPASAVGRHAPYRETKRYLTEHDPGRGPPGWPRLQQVGVLRATAARRRRRRAGGAAAAGTATGPVPRAGLHAVERRLQPGAWGCHRLRPPRRAIPAQAGGGGRPRRLRRRAGGRTRLVVALLGVGASVGDGRRVPELPRPRPRRPGPCLPRNQPRPPAEREGEVRPRQLLPLPPVAWRLSRVMPGRTRHATRSTP
jgi:FAD/FMN-containing dehydrogenase